MRSFVFQKRLPWCFQIAIDSDCSFSARTVYTIEALFQRQAHELQLLQKCYHKKSAAYYDIVDKKSQIIRFILVRREENRNLLSYISTPFDSCDELKRLLR